MRRETPTPLTMRPVLPSPSNAPDERSTARKARASRMLPDQVLTFARPGMKFVGADAPGRMSAPSTLDAGTSARPGQHHGHGATAGPIRPRRPSQAPSGPGPSTKETGPASPPRHTTKTWAARKRQLPHAARPPLITTSRAKSVAYGASPESWLEGQQRGPRFVRCHTPSRLQARRAYDTRGCSPLARGPTLTGRCALLTWADSNRRRP